ncbi:hypothetical protein D9611_010451 [Ephemerocybe angulata]|uniref:Uncharacterized protein n=1 Tax=Ephemerocybe angulata TaxID=980116 RepID=A0A8H5BVE1_9AGAR|nr:hypothetical protein D9611_010451 [Tulosesus angulatus]
MSYKTRTELITTLQLASSGFQSPRPLKAGACPSSSRCCVGRVGAGRGRCYGYRNFLGSKMDWRPSAVRLAGIQNRGAEIRVATIVRRSLCTYDSRDRELDATWSEPTMTGWFPGLKSDV